MSDQVETLLRNLTSMTAQQLAISSLQYYESLRQEAAKQSSRNLNAFGRKIFSQNEEDGIIQEIFNRIGTTNKIFVEFGVEDGLECNTRALLFCGWKGLWIEGNLENVQLMNRQQPKTIDSGQLSVINAFITKDNIDELISSKVTEKEIDLLSIDIDGHDCHILTAISCIRPRVIIIEYNAKFPPPIRYCQAYNENHRWDGTDDFGASITYLDEVLNEMNYKLVTCDLAGVNAFFVREDLLEDKFDEPGDTRHHYQPARYFLLCLASGHPAKHATIEHAEKR